MIITKQNPLLKPPAEKPIVIPSYIPTNVQLSDKPIKLSDEFVAQLSSQLNSLSLTDTVEKGKNKVSSSRSERSLHNIEASSSETSSAIDDSEIIQLNSLVKPEPQRTYYHRPTPVDLLNEETTQYQIATLGHNMLSYANACKIRGNSEETTVYLIVASFFEPA